MLYRYIGSKNSPICGYPLLREEEYCFDFFRRGVLKKNASGFYNALYKGPPCLYTNLTPKLIYYVAISKIGVKQYETNTYSEAMV